MSEAKGSTSWIIGAGGHAKVVGEAWVLGGGQIAGYIDKAAGPEGSGIRAEAELLRKPFPVCRNVIHGLGSVRAGRFRSELATGFVKSGYEFVCVIHPTATVSAQATLGAGVVVLAGAIVAPSATLGDWVIVNHGATVDHDTRVGVASHVAPGAILGGGVVIGDHSHIGSGAIILQGVRVGDGVTVGAGAVVLKDIPDGQTVVGIPARNL